MARRRRTKKGTKKRKRSRKSSKRRKRSKKGGRVGTLVCSCRVRK